MIRYLIAFLALCLVAALAVAGWQHHALANAHAARDRAQAEAIASQFELSLSRIDRQVETHYLERIQIVHDAIKPIEIKVPVYVSPTTDRAFPLPVGFVRLHDAAADLSDLPTPGTIDGTASAVEASTAAGVVVSNYGTYHEIAEQLIALQAWVRERSKLECGAHE
ncbi:hypothetical protein [Dyella sp. ASV21]|uniref:hypothetical protein n=1 Tax=Dyella sp. ASV21 TaxID=2795114 RepID=UPI0018EE15F4|nr:hypothetical protein [Dyella sp. ASV21]